MKCALCGRGLFKTAIQIGREYLGPKCAKRIGVSPSKSKNIKRVHLNQQRPVTTDTLTLPLFEEGEM